MSKIRNISGFPEWLPAEKRLEDSIVDQVKQIYALHGYTPIETRSVELMSTLASKGDINKEIYVVQRAQAEETSVDDDTFALHFDLTVPFARYVSQYFNDLTFPFKRYQLQRSWRGERPQEGRFREFYQFDADVVAIDNLPICHDAEMVTIATKIFRKLALGDFTVRINNRKLLLGIYEHFGLNGEQRQDAITIIDKIAKIGREQVIAELQKISVNSEIANKIVTTAELQMAPSEVAKGLRALEISSDTFQQGLLEMEELISLLPLAAQANVVVDMSLARGLDYYTGTIIETVLNDYQSFGSVCGGGRYDNLTERFSSKKVPGVGISVGVTRLMSLILAKNLAPIVAASPTKVLITLYNEEQIVKAFQIAEEMRELGVATEVFHKPLKLGKQIEFADKKNIPYILFLQDDGSIEIKDLKTKEQKKISLASWCAEIA
ncbi:MAG: histidine--tRNA ligase [Deltaproteobacteria bacterium]|nr:histidine--tRNA ligase [Deltaproteobacteria bacterium]